MENDTLVRAKGAAPLYFQLAAILKKKIEDGEYVPGDLFPTELQLQECYQVSRITVRQAISKLTGDGYLECARGIGTKVVFHKINETLKQVVSFSEEMARHNVHMKTSFCEISLVPASRIISVQLDEKINAPVYRLERVRCTGDIPIVYSITYLNQWRSLPLDPEQYKQSLYRLLNEQYATVVARGNETFEAVVSDAHISALLGTDARMPLIKRTRKTYDQHGKIVEYTICFYPGDRYQYSIDL